LETERLDIREIDLEHSEFIFELVNTDNWIKFIGDRGVKTIQDANVFIQRINNNPNITYWLISLKNESIPIGIISFVKRDYLEHHDIGFALLPQYEEKGYAYEAARHVLQIESQKRLHKKILAITVEGNQRSVRLLKKLGLRFREKMKKGEEDLLVYST
jgi:RimJ/RimL family protein N-acetyltransferase